MKSIKNNEISNLEVNLDFNMKDRMKVAQMLDSIRSIKDLIVVVEKYRARSNAVFEAMLKRERRIQSFPFQVILLGYNDLNRTVKKIVNLASPATAFASSVLPVPGGPTSSTPLGILAPTLKNFFGYFKNSLEWSGFSCENSLVGRTTFPSNKS
jgi:hypothetical protein